MTVQKICLYSFHFFLHVVCFCLLALQWNMVYSQRHHKHHSNTLLEFFLVSLEGTGVNQSAILVHTHFFSSVRKHSMGFRSGLCDCHSKTFTSLALSHIVTTLEVCLGSVSCCKTHLRPRFTFLTDKVVKVLLMSWGFISLFLYNPPVSWIHLFFFF